MNFTPVLDELLICRIASTHHENTEFDHCFSPVAMGDCLINLTVSLNGGVADAFFPPPPPRLRPGRWPPRRLWASRPYQQSIDRVGGCCNLRTARPEVMQDSVQLDLLDTVCCDDGDLPASTEFGVVGRQQPDIPDRAVFRRVKHLRIRQLWHRSRCLDVEKCSQW